MEITISMIKELRAATGASISDCKNTLIKADGNTDKAVEFLREKNLIMKLKSKPLPYGRMFFRCYSSVDEKICWSLHPIKRYEDYRTYTRLDLNKMPQLIIFRTDYEKLLLEHIQAIYPITDPQSYEIEQCFCQTSENWIGKSDWQIIMLRIEAELKRVSNRLPKPEREFYLNFLTWIERELDKADIIIIDCNL